MEILNGLKVPYYVIPGNKDGTEKLIVALRDTYPFHPLPQVCDGLQYVVDDYELRLIAVDTYKEGVMNGELSEERLQWLKESLWIIPAKSLSLLWFISFLSRPGCIPLTGWGKLV